MTIKFELLYNLIVNWSKNNYTDLNLKGERKIMTSIQKKVNARRKAKRCLALVLSAAMTLPFLPHSEFTHNEISEVKAAETQKDTVYGDVNSDGKITILDMMVLKSYLTEKNEKGFSVKAADLDEDGTFCIIDLNKWTGATDTESVTQMAYESELYGAEKTSEALEVYFLMYINAASSVTSARNSVASAYDNSERYDVNDDAKDKREFIKAKMEGKD